GVPTFLVVIRVENSDKVVKLAAAQWIVHEMRPRTGPQHDIRAPKIFWNVLSLENGAISDVTGNPWLPVANYFFADLRPHAVATDQRAACNRLAVVECDPDTIAMVFKRVDAAVVFQRDQIAVLTRLEERSVNVGAVRNTIRLPKPLEKRVAERNVGD